MSRKAKEFQEYLIESEYDHIVQEDYIESPATAFLRYSVDAKDAINQCLRHFPKNQDGSYNKNALTSLQHIIASMLPSIMGHFETYERYLFAGVFEHSSLLKKFDVDKFFKRLKNNEISFSIDPIRLSAYRGLSAPVGILLADNLSGWHNPEKVNRYFQAFGFETNVFSNDDCKKLNILWQLRHSIVHTGGSLSLPDAQKVEELIEFGEKPIVFSDNFILEVSRKLHPLVRDATYRVKQSFTERLIDSMPTDEESRIEKLFMVKSKTAVWLR